MTGACVFPPEEGFHVSAALHGFLQSGLFRRVYRLNQERYGISSQSPMPTVPA